MNVYIYIRIYICIYIYTYIYIHAFNATQWKAMFFNVSPTSSCQTLHSHAYIWHAYIWISSSLRWVELCRSRSQLWAPRRHIFFQGVLILHNSGARWWQWAMSHVDWLPLVHVSGWIIPNSSSTPGHLGSGLQVHHCGWRVPFRVSSCTSPWAAKSGGGISLEEQPNYTLRLSIISSTVSWRFQKRNPRAWMLWKWWHVQVWPPAQVPGARLKSLLLQIPR